MSLLSTLFKIPNVFLWWSYCIWCQQYFSKQRDEQIFKNGFKCGINELLGDDYQKHLTEAEFK